MGKSPQSFRRWWQEGAARKVEKLVSEGRLHGLNTEDESEVTKGAGRELCNGGRRLSAGRAALWQPARPLSGRLPRTLAEVYLLNEELSSVKTYLPEPVSPFLRPELWARPPGPSPSEIRPLPHFSGEESVICVRSRGAGRLHPRPPNHLQFLVL